MVDGLYDLAVDFAAKSDGTVPWGAGKKVKRKVYSDVGGKVGTARGVGPIDRLTVRLRVQNIMLAFVPPGTSWYREINAADPKAPILTWFARKDAFYLEPTRSGIRTVTSMTTTVPPQAGALLHLTTYFLGTVIANLLWHSLAPSLSGIPALTQQKKRRLFKTYLMNLVYKTHVQCL